MLGLRHPETDSERGTVHGRVQARRHRATEERRTADDDRIHRQEGGGLPVPVVRRGAARGRGVRGRGARAGRARSVGAGNGRRARPADHTYAIMNRAAVSYVERSDGRILCVWNSRYGGWTLPGGKVEEGETVEAAQARELYDVFRSHLFTFSSLSLR